MCGLTFVLNSSNYAMNSDDWFEHALIASQVRGTDSTGMFLLHDDYNHDLKKAGVNASYFTGGSPAKELIAKIPKSKFALGHVRAATVGSISAMNAHPFKIERSDGSFLVGAHNGTLRNWRSKEDSEKFSVDSEWLFHMIAKKGEDAFRYFDGAFAVIWYDSRHKDSVFMARNNERPLHYMITDSGKTLIGCSELGMLGWLSDKHDLKCHKDHDTPYYLSAGKLYEFSLSNIGSWTSKEFKAYDYTTSGSGTRTQHSVLYPHMGMYDDDTEAYDDYTAFWGGYRTGSLLDEQEGILKDVKDALREARYTLYRDKNDPVKDEPPTLETDIIDMEALDKALSKAIHTSCSVKNDKLPWTNPTETVLDRGEFMLTSVNSATATSFEVENAKGIGAYGMVVSFAGAWYDDECSDCWGTFRLMENGMEETYEGVIRNIPRSVAEDVYINRHMKDTELCAVVGVDNNVTFFVIAPLKKDEKNYVLAMTAERELTAGAAH